MHTSWSRSLILAVLNCGLTTAGTSRGKLKCAIHTHPMNRPDQSKAKETKWIVKMNSEILPVLHFPWNKQSKCKAHCYGGLFTFLFFLLWFWWCTFGKKCQAFFFPPPVDKWQIWYCQALKKNSNIHKSSSYGSIIIARIVTSLLAVLSFMLSHDTHVLQVFTDFTDVILFLFLPSLPQSFHVSSSQSRSNKIVTNVQVVHIFCGNYWWRPADCAFCRLHQFQLAYD